MSEENTNQNKIVDLSELKNLQFSTAWSVSPNDYNVNAKINSDRKFFKPFKKRFEKGSQEEGENQQDGKQDNRKRYKKPFKKQPFNFTMEVLLYPEDAPFAKLSEVMRKLKRTYQLFDLVRLILEKAERFIVLAKNLPNKEGVVEPLYCAQPLNLPFEKEEDAKMSAIKYWLKEMFEKQESGAYKLKESDTVFNTKDAAIEYITSQKQEELVKVYEQVRMHGVDVFKLPKFSRIRKNILAAWKKQKNFPIITANNLRGRLRRAGFTLYKRGSKGYTFVSAVKRKFLFNDESLSEIPQKIYDFILEHQAIKAAELPYLYLGMVVPTGIVKSAPLSDEQKKESEKGEVSEPLPTTFTTELSEEDSKKLKEISNELLWLISEGYVVEYEDSTLQANPKLPRPKGKAKEIVQDTENLDLGEADEPIFVDKASEQGEEESTEENAEEPLESEEEPEQK